MASVSKRNLGHDRDRDSLLSWDEMKALADNLSPDSEAARLLHLLHDAAASGQISVAANSSKCLLLHYRYGERIVKNGRFQLPEGSGALSHMDGFKRRSVPLAFLLDAPVEVFRDDKVPTVKRGHTLYKKGGGDLPWGEKSHNHPRPLRVFHSGSIIGLFQFVEELIGKPSKVATYSLAAGEVSVYVGAPLTSDETSAALTLLKARLMRSSSALQWRYWHPYERLFQELIPESWNCRIVLLPDWLSDAIQGLESVHNHLLLTYAKQMHQTQVESEDQALVRVLSHKHALEYADQISHLLGIARGNVPALVPWHRSKPRLPIDDVAPHLWNHFRRRPTSRREENEGYYPFVMVPRHLEPGELGYFSCRWNTGPVAVADAPMYTSELHNILSEYFAKLFPDKRLSDVFVPFVHAVGLGPIHGPFLDRDCKPLDERDLYMEVRSRATPTSVKALSAQNSDLKGASQWDRDIQLYRRGFLNAGFVIRRVSWL